MYCPPPNFLAVVFKKQEISQQVVTRMQDLASEFSKKNSGGDTPRPSQREGAIPFCTQHPARPLTRCGAQAPWCWGQTLAPLNFLAVVAPMTSGPVSTGMGNRLLASKPCQPTRSALPGHLATSRNREYLRMLIIS